MGVQAFMSIEAAPAFSIATIATGTANYPAAGSVSIVTILPAGDIHRYVEVFDVVRKLITYARDENIYVGAGSVAIVSSIDGTIRVESIAANIVTGDIALMIVGSEKAKGSRNILDIAHRDLLNYMNENARLTA